MSHPREWNAGSYHAVSQPQFQWGQAVLERLPLRGDETVLDAGCGTGRLTAELLHRLPRGHVVAVDQSHQMLAAARETLGDDGRVRYLQADLAHLSVEPPVDAVFSTATFHWVLDHDALFASLARALRPGGALVAQFGGAGNLEKLYGRAHALLSQAPYATHFSDWTEPLYFADEAATRARLAASGFVDAQVWRHDAPTPFADAEAFRAFLITVVLRAHLERLPQELQASLLDTLTQRYAADAEPWVLDYWRLNVVARRAG